MGLRCSLLGHDFGDSITERDREERGQEVVTTVREVRECRRCGTEQVVSENTEVRRVERGADTDGPGTEEPSGPGEPAAEREPERRPEPDSPSAGDSADGEDVDVSAFVESAEGSSADETGGSPGDSAVDPTDESVEMIDQGGGESDESPDERDSKRETGDDEQSGEAADTAEPPTRDEDDEPEDDAIILTDDIEGEVDRSADSSRRDVVDAGNMFDASPPQSDDGDSADRRETRQEEAETGSAGPESSAPGEDAWDGSWEEASRPPAEQGQGESPEESGFQFHEDVEGRGNRDRDGGDELDPRSGITSAGSIDTTGPPDGDLDVTFTCPECGYAVRAADSSLRAGDICPECHGGYLSEAE
ncbi:MAG: hypothetical protein ABEI31_01455 [Halodesulfurarchaeum sp.]